MPKVTPGHRSNYVTEVVLATRWDDNDIYGHLNNTVHYRLFDTAVNGFLIASVGFDPLNSEVIGVVAESGCRYYAELRFPQTIFAGLRVARIGTTSVRYEIGLFTDDTAQAAAEGYFVHVFVNRETRRPQSLPDWLRSGVQSIRIPGSS